MTNSNNNEPVDQELSQEQLKDAAGGAGYIKFDGVRASRGANSIDKSTPLQFQVNEGPGHMKVSLGGSGGEDRLSPDA